MKSLTLGDILYIHKTTIEKHGGSNGVKNIGLVESSLSSGIATFDGDDLYKSVEDKISMIAYSFIKNHGFEDGNKRVGCVVLLALCHRNDLKIKPSQQAVIDLGLGVAKGDLNREDIKAFILKHK